VILTFHRESQFYLAPAGAVCLLATGSYYEGSVLWASGDLRLLRGAPLVVAGAASLGLGVQLLTAAVIQALKRITHDYENLLPLHAIILVHVYSFFFVIVHN